MNEGNKNCKVMPNKQGALVKVNDRSGKQKSVLTWDKMLYY